MGVLIYSFETNPLKAVNIYPLVHCVHPEEQLRGADALDPLHVLRSAHLFF